MISRRESDGQNTADKRHKRQVNKRTRSFESSASEETTAVQKKSRLSQDNERCKRGDEPLEINLANGSTTHMPNESSNFVIPEMLQHPLQSYHSTLFSSPPSTVNGLHQPWPASSYPCHYPVLSESAHSNNIVAASLQHNMELMELLRLSTGPTETNLSHPSLSLGSLSQRWSADLISPLHSLPASFPFAMRNPISNSLLFPPSQIDPYAFHPDTAQQCSRPNYSQEWLKSYVAANHVAIGKTTTFPGIDADAFHQQLRPGELLKKYPAHLDEPSEQPQSATSISQQYQDGLQSFKSGAKRIPANSFLSHPVDSSLALANINESKPSFNATRTNASRRDNTSGPPRTMPLAQPEDRGMLNDHLIFLRKQIEYFEATVDDIMSYTRGRNKGIAMQQVGIRCRHCSHIPADRRRKGSTYYPFNLMGIYQAAQNINVEHLQSGLCTEMPPDVQGMLLTTRATKTANSSAGKAYWADSAQRRGMMDTEDGIRFVADTQPTR